jgi:4-hydroxy-tetrahydrodipicolinate synthase
MALKELVNFQINHETPALYFLGTAGEKAALTDIEWREIVEFVAGISRNGTKFFFGGTGHNTANTLERLAFLQDCSADGAMLTVPTYLGPTTHEAVEFFLRSADASDLPLGIYNNPARLITDLDPSLLTDVLAHPNVVVYKEGSPNTCHASSLLSIQADVSIMAADTIDPDIVTPIMALGGHGICNAFGNLAPREAVVLSTPWSSAPSQASIYREEFLRLRELMDFVYSLRSPIALKGLMREIGMPSGVPRLPLQPADTVTIEKGMQIIRSLNILDSYEFRKKC